MKIKEFFNELPWFFWCLVGILGGFIAGLAGAAHAEYFEVTLLTQLWAGIIAVSISLIIPMFAWFVFWLAGIRFKPED